MSKRQVINLRNCCIWLIYLNCIFRFSQYKIGVQKSLINEAKVPAVLKMLRVLYAREKKQEIKEVKLSLSFPRRYTEEKNVWLYTLRQ